MSPKRARDVRTNTRVVADNTDFLSHCDHVRNLALFHRKCLAMETQYGGHLRATAVAISCRGFVFSGRRPALAVVLECLPREMEWIERPDSAGGVVQNAHGSSACLMHLGRPSLEEMKQRAEEQREKSVCPPRLRRSPQI
jgi:hypothetical protein